MKTKIALMIAVVLALSLTALHADGEVCETIEAYQSAVPAAGQGPLQIGEYINARFESPHPYPVATGDGPRMVFSQEITHPGAAYIAPHFSRMELAPGDFVVIRSPSGEKRWQYERFGTADLGRSGEGGFWGVHVYGPTAVVELWSAGGKSDYGFEIDQYARGFTDEEMGFGESGESICTANDKLNAKCYQVSEPLRYDTGRAIAKLVMNGATACTGWLVGDQGHLMTNEHCVGSQATANNTTFEFMFEAADCAGTPASGTIEATSATLVAVSSPLDYSYLVPSSGTNLPATYGFLQLRPSGAVLEERIYSVQHAGGRDKELAIVSTYPENPSGFAEVDSVTEVPCSGGSVDTGYFMDTEGGSSGSPVLGWDDNCVISLHHCRGSGFCATGGSGDDPNRGVPIEAVIADIGMGNMPASSFCIDDPDAVFADGFESGDTSAWDVTVLP